MKLILKSLDVMLREYGEDMYEHGVPDVDAGLSSQMIEHLNTSLIVDILYTDEDSGYEDDWYWCTFGDYGDWSVSPDMIDTILPDVEDSIKFLETLKDT